MTEEPAEVLRLGDVLGADRLRRLRTSGRNVHAYLIAGPRGSGRRTAARALAAAVLCRSPAGGDACGQCPDCRDVVAGRHPDLHLLAGHRLDDAKAIVEAAALRPARGAHSVFVLADADALTPEAAAALLKAIEEPAPGALFILTAVSPGHVPETIVSRCQVVPLLPVAGAELRPWLRARGLSSDLAAEVAAASGGWPGLALAMAGEQGWRAGRDGARDFLATVAAADRPWQALLAAANAAESADLGQLQVLLRERARTAGLRRDRTALTEAADAFAATTEAAAALENHVGVRLTWDILALRLRQIAAVRYNRHKP